MGVPLHPAPLYEALVALAIGALLVRSLARRRVSGEVFAQFVVAYGAARLLLAPLRGDAPLLPGAFAWMATICAGGALWIWLRQKP